MNKKGRNNQGNISIEAAIAMLFFALFFVSLFHLMDCLVVRNRMQEMVYHTARRMAIISMYRSSDEEEKAINAHEEVMEVEWLHSFLNDDAPKREVVQNHSIEAQAEVVFQEELYERLGNTLWNRNEMSGPRFDFMRNAVNNHSFSSSYLDADGNLHLIMTYKEKLMNIGTGGLLEKLASKDVSVGAVVRCWREGLNEE